MQFYKGINMTKPHKDLLGTSLVSSEINLCYIEEIFLIYRGKNDNRNGK